MDILSNNHLPGVLFTMRYPDDAGYVWNTVAQVRDAASGHLAGRARGFLAFPRLTGQPTYHPRHLEPVELDCYDVSAEGRRALARFITGHNIKVVVFMSALPSTVSVAMLRRLGVRTINTENDSFDHRKRDGLLKRGVKILLRRVLRRQLHDMHLANSISQRRFLLSYAQLPPERVEVMANAIDCERFSPGDQAAARAITGLDGETFWIVCVSQARPEKRIEALIRVAAEVIAARPGRKIGFVYVGDGPPVAQWKQLAAELGVAGQFLFAGRRNDLVPWYRSADLMVHAAERESFGLAIVESMACAVPVVASAAAGPSETILEDRTGMLIGLQDFGAFTRAVLRYVDDPALARAHGGQARDHVLATYNLERQGRQLATHIARFFK